MATTNKRTTKSKNEAAKKRALKKQKEQKKKVFKTLGLITLYIVFAVLMFLSFYSMLLSYFGEIIKNTFLGLFGSVSYILPFGLIYGFIYYFMEKKRKGNFSKLYLLSGIFLNLSIIFELAAYKGQAVPIIIENFFTNGINHIGGGIVGGFIAEPVKSLISFTGALILFIVTLMFLLFAFFYEQVLLLSAHIVKTIKERKEQKKLLEKEEKKNKDKKEEKAEIKEAKPLNDLENVLVYDDDKIPEPETYPDKNPDRFDEILASYEMPKAKEDDLNIEDNIVLIERTELEQELLNEKENLDNILSGGKNIPEKEGEPPAKKTVNRKIEYKFPSVELLEDNKAVRTGGVSDLKEKAIKLENILESFGVDAEVVNIEKGPSITRFELQPKSGVRISKIQSLSDDIKMNLAAASIRISPIPGKTVIGIEIPNDKTTPVFIKDIITSDTFKEHKSKIAFTVGMDITGNPIIGDLAKMPHVLIAGATGSGKSVCINTLITSILYKATPNEVKLIMIDPKVVELGVYNGIPHLLIPVVTDPKKAAGALNWAVMEMENRYKLFAQAGVRNIEGYNSLCEKNNDEDGKLPQIVIIIDELADLMMVASKEVESYICRIAQLARAAGMHLVIATQRPSVNVITGLIKANVPSRIAFAVTSQIDSRTILDMSGAEKLLGKGDMLYYPQGESKPMRVQGSLIVDKEVERVVNVVKANSEVVYNEDILEHLEKEQTFEGDTKSREEEALDADEMLPQAIEVILDNNQASVSLLQRKLKLGYSRAARIVDQMEERGIVGPSEGSKPRQILITKEQYYEMEINSMRN